MAEAGLLMLVWTCRNCGKEHSERIKLSSMSITKANPLKANSDYCWTGQCSRCFDTAEVYFS